MVRLSCPVCRFQFLTGLLSQPACRPAPFSRFFAMSEKIHVSAFGFSGFDG